MSPAAHLIVERVYREVSDARVRVAAELNLSAHAFPQINPAHYTSGRYSAGSAGSAGHQRSSGPATADALEAT